MPQLKVKGVYDYNSPEEDDLNFPAGQIISVTEEEGPDWYVGEYIDDVGNHHSGLFPRNFVEKYEPEPPPRPNRASRFKPLEQPQAPVAPPEEQVEPEPAPVEKEEPAPPKPQPAPVEIPPVAKSQLSPTSPAPTSNAKHRELPQEASESAKPSPAAPPSGKKAPPPVAAKSSSFRDRIAAFNSPAASPVQPFKPGGGPPATFIKKPFVAPPPSRNAYVPPPREAPQVTTSYRREEDPEIVERQAQDQENADKAGLAAQPSNHGNAEDQPKPTSLKERIALLQRQQAEQAQRASGIQKEKPRKPPVKKRTESQDGRPNEDEDVSLEKATITEPKERGSMDHARPPRSSHGIKSPDPAAFHREILSDANDADQSGAGDTEDAEGSSTSVENEDSPPPRADTAPTDEPDVGEEEGADEEEEEENEMDAETRRKLELRERMAKMSGGMGMAGMFGAPRGPPMGAPPKRKPSAPERKPTADNDEHASSQQRVAMLPMPGMPVVKSSESEATQLGEETDNMTPHVYNPSRQTDDEPHTNDVIPQSMKRMSTFERPPPVPQEKRPISQSFPTADRPVPPPLPSDSRPAPRQLRSPSPGSESGDEMTDAPVPHSDLSPRIPFALNTSKRMSYLASDEMSQDSSERRVPPIPLASPTLSPTLAYRSPPPPPPTAIPPSRQGTMDSISNRIDRNDGESDYEGDYDTDIAPGATHKDALKSHTRELSVDDSVTTDEPSSARSPTTPHGIPPLPPFIPRAVPPPPPPQPLGRVSVDAPRAVPPPPPLQPPGRVSVDAPRAVPPPPPLQPPSRVSVDAPRAVPPLPPTSPPLRNFQDDDEEYDPYKYIPVVPPPPPRAIPPPHQSQPPVPQNRPPPPLPSMLPPMPQQQVVDPYDEDDLYSAPPPRKSHDRPPPPPPQAHPHQQQPPPLPQGRAAPPPPPQERAAPRPPPLEPTRSYRPQPMGRMSLDTNRAIQQSRVSMDQSRPSASREFIASDVDLGMSSHWWTQSNIPPPSLQKRKDILWEMNETRDDNIVEKSIYVLYMDYSQTIITARFETNNVSDVEVDQRQEPPPIKLRQDQLEAAHDTFGVLIAKDVESKQLTIVGDGTPHGLINELLRPHKDALRPVSTRAFGSLVYANLANASTQQYDEIRPGDIISFRNARFQGKHGAMHAKYSVDVGKPDHVGVVVEWDGSKKKVRVWEQGRESKKVKPESFRMGDLRSGEVRVWRVMSRQWVGWQ